MIMKEVFDFVELSYSLRNDTKFKSRNVCTVRFGIETPSFMGPKLWNLMPSEIKNSSSLTEFKSRIKYWIPEHCPCKISKTFIPQLGYI